VAEIIHYQDPMSRAMRPQRVLAAFGIPHTKVHIAPRAGDHKKPEYAAIHPLQRVPALKHGDVLIVESGAICLYLADLFAEKMNTPKPGTPERARFYEWIFFLQTTLEPLAILGFEPSKKEEASQKVRDILDGFASKFVGPFVLGAQFSVADVILETELSWCRMMGIFPAGLEPYDDFMKRMAQRSTAGQ
jgi:glutathione S-transferase